MLVRGGTAGASLLKRAAAGKKALTLAGRRVPGVGQELWFLSGTEIWA